MVEYFVNKYSREYNKSIKGVSRDAMRAFISYSWPGNVRELENKIQQLVVMSLSSEIGLENIQFPTNRAISHESELEYFKEAKIKAINSFEKGYLIQLLTKHRGDVVSAARRSGKSRTALWNLLKKHNLSPKQFQ